MNANLTIVDGRGVLRMERHLPHRPEQVWRALTEPALLDRWFPANVTVDLWAGGAITFVFPGDQAPPLTGRVNEVEAPTVFAYTWGDDVLAWRVEPEGSGAMLALTHTFDDIPAAASFATGWSVCIDALAQVLDGVEVTAEGDTAALHEKYIGLFGLDAGSIERDGDRWRVRFERQLRSPVEAVWADLGDPTFAEEGADVPAAATIAGFPAGPITAVDAPFFLTYHWLADGRPAGDVRWEVAEGPGGARLLLTHTGTGDRAEEALAAWHDAIASLAMELLRRR